VLCVLFDCFCHTNGNTQAKYQAQQAAYKEATAATAAAARKAADEVAQREAAELKAVLEQSVLDDTGYQVLLLLTLSYL
jgi:hypothetical protein